MAIVGYLIILNKVEFETEKTNFQIVLLLNKSTPLELNYSELNELIEIGFTPNKNYVLMSCRPPEILIDNLFIVRFLFIYVRKMSSLIMRFTCIYNLIWNTGSVIILHT